MTIIGVQKNKDGDGDDGEDGDSSGLVESFAIQENQFAVEHFCHGENEPYFSFIANKTFMLPT